MKLYLVDDPVSSTADLLGYLVVVGGEVAEVRLDLVVLIRLADLGFLLVGGIWLLLFLFICHQLLYDWLNSLNYRISKVIHQSERTPSAGLIFPHFHAAHAK